MCFSFEVHVSVVVVEGKVDQAQLEALMTRGLSEEEAVDMIIKGML